MKRRVHRNRYLGEGKEEFFKERTGHYAFAHMLSSQIPGLRSCHIANTINLCRMIEWSNKFGRSTRQKAKLKESSSSGPSRSFGELM